MYPYEVREITNKFYWLLVVFAILFAAEIVIQTFHI
jgi:hypothetical protein